MSQVQSLPLLETQTRANTSNYKKNQNFPLRTRPSLDHSVTKKKKKFPSELFLLKEYPTIIIPTFPHVFILAFSQKVIFKVLKFYDFYSYQNNMCSFYQMCKVQERVKKLEKETPKTTARFLPRGSHE